MAIAGAVLFARYGKEAAGQPNRVVVAPFDLPDEAGHLLPWRVGLATGLTERLATGDGLETVPQPQVAATWRSRQTPMISAVELARRTAAARVVYGRVERGPGDTLTLRAAVLDAYSATGVFEVALRLPPDAPLDHAADTLAAVLLARWDEP